MPDITITRPLTSKNNFYYLIGLFFLFLNKFRHSLKGYTTPRTFSPKMIERSVKYDFNIVQNWWTFLSDYTNHNTSFIDKNILEIGPGEDLGIGLILLAKGAKKYNAIDVNFLIKNASSGFYKTLFEKIKDEMPDIDVDELRGQLGKTLSGNNDKLNYIYDKNLSFSVFANDKIDLVLSNAAFEHLNDFHTMIHELTAICIKGCILISEIDLKTHTRWIKDKDPENIYRYPKSLYNTLKFQGSPNRLRPKDYQKSLMESGWKNIKIHPLNILENKYFQSIQNSLHYDFRAPENQMEILSFILCATKA